MDRGGQVGGGAAGVTVQMGASQRIAGASECLRPDHALVWGRCQSAIVFRTKQQENRICRRV